MNKISREYVARAAGKWWVRHTLIVGLGPFSLPFDKPVETKAEKNVAAFI
jgi:hypothetical protein